MRDTKHLESFAKQRAENELSWKIISDKYLSIIKSLTN